jgi:hypothetical protein
MLGYASPYKDMNYSNTIALVKNSHIIWDLDNNDRESIRHDVVLQNYPDNLNLLSLSHTDREEKSSENVNLIEQYDYKELMEDSIENYSESEEKLPLPDEETTPIEDNKNKLEKTTSSDQTSEKKFAFRKPREDVPPEEPETRKSFRLRNFKTMLTEINQKGYFQ